MKLMLSKECAHKVLLNPRMLIFVQFCTIRAEYMQGESYGLSSIFPRCILRENFAGLKCNYIALGATGVWVSVCIDWFPEI